MTVIAAIVALLTTLTKSFVMILFVIIIPAFIFNGVMCIGQMFASATFVWTTIALSSFVAVATYILVTNRD